jgi:ribosomal protein RSM22 (predicted rRNA methylase)
MEMPNELRLAIDKQTVGLNHAQLMQDAQTLSIRYRTESGNGKRLLTRDNEATAYSVVRMPATFGAVSTALEYALDLAECNPVSLLDVGAGTGTAAWAADALLDLKSIVCLEREGAMRRVGQNLMIEASQPLCNAKWICHDLIVENIPEKADLVIASYVLNEMGDEERIKIIEKLWNATIMMLLLVEPGTPVGYSQLKKARDFLLEHSAHIAAPCPHEFDCKIKKDDWCHFICRVARSRLHRQLKDGEAPYEDEKFTYLAITREKYRHADARILRHPFIEKGRITLDICSQNGINKITVYKKDGALFKQARKARCGDEIHYQ